MFSSEIRGIFKKTFFTEHLRWLLLNFVSKIILLKNQLNIYKEHGPKEHAPRVWWSHMEKKCESFLSPHDRPCRTYQYKIVKDLGETSCHYFFI